MARRPNSSKQTEAVLAALLATVGRWRHGYDLSRETTLKSGTLYPILIRLESQGWLEARWEEEPAPGKPRRHLYRLTNLGAAEGGKILYGAHEHGRSAPLVPAREGTVE